MINDLLSDGPIIRAALSKALKQGASLATAFATVREARYAGLNSAVRIE